jgi:homoserine kinase
VTVRPPATSANLGPGFDSFGLALELRDEVVVEITGSGLAVEVFGEGAGEVPRDEGHLLVRALRAGFDALGGQPLGLRVVCRNRIPHGRGLGSSSAAIVAGLAAARALVEDGGSVLDAAALLDLATRLEGHPDNVAPALCGGLTIAWLWEQDVAEPGPGGPERTGQSAAKEERADVLRLAPDPAVGAVAFIPPTPLATSVARGLLPTQVPHRDAAFNAGRAGLLAAALTTTDLTHHHRAVLLRAATRDRLHQDYRAPAMPDSAALIRRLRADGYAALVSGAGPTVLALTVGPGWPQKAAGYAPEGWRAVILPIAATGVATGP